MTSILGKFKVGRLLQTNGIYTACIDNQELFNEIYECLKKYIECNWGDTCKEDIEMNDSAVKNNDDRIVAKYNLKTIPKSIFIITEYDRSATTIMFCEEY